MTVFACLVMFEAYKNFEEIITSIFLILILIWRMIVNDNLSLLSFWNQIQEMEKHGTALMIQYCVVKIYIYTFYRFNICKT